MELPFTHKPGRRERHLLRRHENPLFGWPAPEVAPELLLAAQKADHEAMETFREAFPALIQRAVDLPPDAGSELVLALKQDLERAYESSFGLPEDHARERQALRRLIDLITNAVRRAAGADPLALQELDEEAEARALHFQMLEQPLVADLLDPESPIAPEDLAACLLAGDDAEARAALDLFDPAQIADLAARAVAVVEQLETRGLDVEHLRPRLRLLRARSGADPSVGH